MSTARVSLRIPEVAEATGASESSVKRWVRSGRLRHVRVGGVVLIRPADLDAFLESHAEGLPARLRSTA